MPDYMLKGPNDQSYKLSVPDGTSEADIGHQVAQMMPSDANQAQDARDAAAQRTIRSAVPGERQEGPITRWAVGMGEGFKSDIESMGRQLVRDPGGFMVGMVGGSGGERVKGAAIRYAGKIYEGPIHATISDDIEAQLGREINHIPEHDIGFTTSTGRFVGRQEAADIAEKSGQYTRPKEYSKADLDAKDLPKNDPLTAGDPLADKDDVLKK